MTTMTRSTADVLAAVTAEIGQKRAALEQVTSDMAAAQAKRRLFGRKGDDAALERLSAARTTLLNDVAVIEREQAVLAQQLESEQATSAQQERDAVRALVAQTVSDGAELSAQYAEQLRELAGTGQAMLTNYRAFQQAIRAAGRIGADVSGYNRAPQTPISVDVNRFDRIETEIRAWLAQAARNRNLA